MLSAIPFNPSPPQSPSIVDVHRRPVLLFDGPGLAVFAVTGTQKALAAASIS